MKNSLLALLLLISFGTTNGFAGGRPAMFVVVDRVETTQDHSSISMIRIWGSFIRTEGFTGNYSKPIFGYMQFGNGSDKEAQKWRKSAGTGKAVVVGYCAGAGAFDTAPIHPADDKPKDLGNNVPYPTGHFELFGPNGLDGKNGDLFGSGRFNDDPEVKSLLSFAATKGTTKAVSKNPGPQPVDDAWVGKWTIEFANGVVETCDLAKDGKANIVEPKRSSSGKVSQSTNENLILVFDDDRVERWTKIGNRIVVEHWPSSAQFPVRTPTLGIGEQRKGD